MVEVLPHRIKSDFGTDEEFIAYMKKRRIQASNIRWRLKHPDYDFTKYKRRVKPVTKPYKTKLVEADGGLKIVDKSITIIF